MSQNSIQVIAISGATSSGKSRLSSLLSKEKGFAQIISQTDCKLNNLNLAEVVKKEKEKLKSNEFIVLEGSTVLEDKNVIKMIDLKIHIEINKAELIKRKTAPKSEHNDDPLKAEEIETKVWPKYQEYLNKVVEKTEDVHKFDGSSFDLLATKAVNMVKQKLLSSSGKKDEGDQEVGGTPVKKQKLNDDKDGNSKSQQNGDKKSSKQSKDDDEEEDFDGGAGSQAGDSYDSDFDQEDSEDEVAEEDDKSIDLEEYLKWRKQNEGNEEVNPPAGKAGKAESEEDPYDDEEDKE